MRLPLTLLFSFCLFGLQAQRVFFAGALGGAGYHGDLSAGFFKTSLIHSSGGLGAEYEISNRLMARAWIMLGVVEGNDREAGLSRNLNFTSGINEFSAGLQYQLLNMYEKRISPYVFASAGIF